MGVITGRVKGGFAVDINGAVAFLPGSQVDLKPIKDISPLLNKSQPMVISRWTNLGVILLYQEEHYLKNLEKLIDQNYYQIFPR